MSTRLRAAGALAALALGVPALAGAQYVTPTSYTATPGQGQAQGGSFNYFDETGRQLIDGVVGANNWADNLGNGPAYEWVGWVTVNPTFTFSFAGPTLVRAVEIGFNRGSGGVDLPSFVTIAGQSFAVAPDALPFGTRGFLTFDIADVTTSSLTIDVTRAANWVFMDEVRFRADAQSVVPEPSTYALLATGLLGVVGIARRRTRG